MAIASGTSLLGLQTINLSAEAPQRLLSIAITSQPLPPVRRLGYWWLFHYQDVSPFQCYVVEEGILRAPGTLISLRVEDFGLGWSYRLDAEWSLAGVPYITSIA